MPGDRFHGDVWIRIMQYISPHDILMSVSLVSTAVRAHSVKALTTLDVGGRKNITDAVARQLSKLIALKTLSVACCDLTDEAGRGGLPQHHGCRAH